MKDKFIIAHRGLHNQVRVENTMPAFQEALKQKIAIELDVHLLKDFNIVVFHDDDLSRLLHIDKKIKDCTYEELKTYFFSHTKETIPLFQDVLNLINGEVYLDIEIKYDNKIGVLEKRLVHILDNYSGPFSVKSFHPLSVLWFRIHRPHYQRGQLVGEYKKNKLLDIILRHISWNLFTKPNFVAYQKEYASLKYVQKIRKKCPLYLWTIHGVEELKTYQLFGDGFIYEE